MTGLRNLRNFEGGELLLRVGLPDDYEAAYAAERWHEAEMPRRRRRARDKAKVAA
jgi:hypothetical protein